MFFPTTLLTSLVRILIELLCHQIGVLEWIRTTDLPLRRRPLYPTEPQGQIVDILQYLSILNL